MTEICKGCGTGDLVCKSCGAVRSPDGETRYDGPPPETTPAPEETPPPIESTPAPAEVAPAAAPAPDSRVSILEYL